MQYSDSRLLNRVAGLPTFEDWPTGGVLDVWVRSKADAPNLFDDKVYSFDCERPGMPKFEMVCTGTSNAGSPALRKPVNPRGCAILASNTIVYNSHRFGKHKNKYFAYVQNRAFPFYRDNNHNLKCDEIGQLYTGAIIGANCHHAGTKSIFIDRWSEGCLVRNVLSEFFTWLEFCDQRALTVCILKEF